MAVEALEKLSECFARLPGIGRKSAGRMALWLARDKKGLISSLMTALAETQKNVKFCSRCGSVTNVENDPCLLCTDSLRDSHQLCVVEDPGDIVLMEQSGAFAGRYHALMGRISPMKGEGPGSIRIKNLFDRLKSENIGEVILALSTDLEGDATSSYLAEEITSRGVKVTRLAFGLPAGSGIRYSDAVTLSKAFQGRR